MSCVRHLQSIWVPQTRGVAYELRCTSCYSAARSLHKLNRITGTIVVIGFIFIIAVFIAFFLLPFFL